MRWLLRLYAVIALALSLVVFGVWIHSYSSVGFVSVRNLGGTRFKIIAPNSLWTETGPRYATLYIEHGRPSIALLSVVGRNVASVSVYQYYTWPMPALAAIFTLPTAWMV